MPWIPVTRPAALRQCQHMLAHGYYGCCFGILRTESTLAKTTIYQVRAVAYANRGWTLVSLKFTEHDKSPSGTSWFMCTISLGVAFPKWSICENVENGCVLCSLHAALHCICNHGMCLRNPCEITVQTCPGHLHVSPYVIQLLNRPLVVILDFQMFRGIMCTFGGQASQGLLAMHNVDLGGLVLSLTWKGLPTCVIILLVVQDMCTNFGKWVLCYNLGLNLQQTDAFSWQRILVFLNFQQECQQVMPGSGVQAQAQEITCLVGSLASMSMNLLSHIWILPENVLWQNGQDVRIWCLYWKIVRNEHLMNLIFVKGNYGLAN